MIKLVHAQMPPPGLDRLMQPLGEFSPMGLAWTYFGYSKGYNIFVGIVEILAGFHGTADDEISIHETERIVDSLQKCNGNITFHRLKGEGHGIQYLYEHNPEIYKWMLKQKKTAI